MLTTLIHIFLFVCATLGGLDNLFVVARVPLVNDSGTAGNGVVVLAAELLEGLAGCLGDQERGEAAEKHEEGVDLEDVVQPGGGIVLGGATGTEGGDGTLADDGTNLARGSGDAVRGGAVAGGEDLTRDNEGGGVGA